jgi:hypothetical protein
MSWFDMLVSSMRPSLGLTKGNSVVHSAVAGLQYAVRLRVAAQQTNNRNAAVS